ncbi:LLM class flavin-dependent oxidoreductase [Virgisporangium ochraceum]|uniref:Monooxygenase n=1 Tax=Virgisporangium ochraceum TaxID=65505 RepID=A0A8J4E8K4_9ACTN|nr:LLM class flavin-dependent oxidoreductase [Virgisporangium ochraceum]GIJ65454.1 monooxygenase [Virgisporangium ochraceum]
MRIGIGLPNTLTVPGPTVVDWARRAEERGFQSLATIDRIVYPSYDSLTTLAVAAGATSRVTLFSNILLGPVYPPVWLAKATASLDALSGGRLLLGLGVGGRPDDFAAMDRPFEQRGKLMDGTLDLLHRAWAGEEITGDDVAVGPAPARGNRVPVLMGGTSDAAIRRTVQQAEGWTAGGGGPEMAAPVIEKVRAAWKDAGRDGEPRFGALVYFGLGDEAESRASLLSYYGFLGEWAGRIADSAIRTAADARAVARRYADLGVTDLAFDPTIASLDEVDRLADAVL